MPRWPSPATIWVPPGSWAARTLAYRAGIGRGQPGGDHRVRARAAHRLPAAPAHRRPGQVGCWVASLGAQPAPDGAPGRRGRVGSRAWRRGPDPYGLRSGTAWAVIG